MLQKITLHKIEIKFFIHLIYTLSTFNSRNNNSKKCWRKQTKTVFNCSKTKAEAPELGVNYVQS